MIKIISHTLTIDEQTFSPKLEVVLQLPMEPTHDQMAVNGEFYEKFGREFFSALEKQRNS